METPVQLSICVTDTGDNSLLHQLRVMATVELEINCNIPNILY